MFFTDRMAKDVSDTIKDIIMENQEKIFEIFLTMQKKILILKL